MSALIRTVFAFALAAASFIASAAPVSIPFVIRIDTLIGQAEGVAVGNEYSGTARYDDAGLVADGDGNFLIDPANGLEIDFLFTRSTLEGGAFVTNSLLVSPAGQILGMDFSLDIGNDLFFSVTGLTFTFDFSKLVVNPDDPEGERIQQTIAEGTGTVVTERIPVSEPATAVLLLPMLALFATRRRSALSR